MNHVIKPLFSTLQPVKISTISYTGCVSKPPGHFFLLALQRLKRYDVGHVFGWDYCT